MAASSLDNRGKATEIHNELVDHLGQHLEPQDFIRLKELFRNCPLTPADLNGIQDVNDLFKLLTNYTKIDLGSYETIISKLKVINRQQARYVEEQQRRIQKILDGAKEMAISTHKLIYETQEESIAAFIDCNVDPVPNSIEWKRDKRPPLEKRVVIDNHEYFSGVEVPTLVIRNPNRLMDEGYYQCTAEANGKSVDGDVVQLQVFAVEPGVSRANTIIPSQSSLTEHELNQPTPAMHASVDQGSQMSFKIPQDIDLKRRKSKEDVSDEFERVTRAKKRAKTGEFGKGSVIICIDISPASNSSEPSSLHLAEEFKHYLLDGGTIQLTDESQTVLHVDKEASFKITPQAAAKDGHVMDPVWP